MKKNSYRFSAPKTLKTISIVLGSMTVAFIIGLQTAGDVKPVISSTKAGGAVVEGDFNDDGILSIADVEIALEIARGNEIATPHDLAADPNQDFHITMDDVAIMLQTMEITKQK